MDLENLKENFNDSYDEDLFDLEEEIDDNNQISKDDWIKISQDEYIDSLFENVFDPSAKMINLQENNSPTKIFELFFPDRFFNTISEQTNLYFLQFKNANPNYLKENQSSHLHYWQDLSIEKAKSFIGIIFLMGINSRDCLEDHWSNDELLNSIISKYISRSNFFLYWRFLHISDNSKNSKKIGKVEEFSKHLIQNWNNLYDPGKFLALDETTIGFKGNSEFIQYNKKKPTRYGIKLFSLADSKTSYMLNFILYQGRSHPKKEGLGLVDTVVRDLLTNYKNSNHCVFMDSYYTSPNLFHDLFKNGLECVGTVQNNRRAISENMKRSEPENGQTIFYKNKEIQYTTWKSRKRVNVLSTLINTEVKEIDYFDRKEKMISKKNKPLIISHYSKFMKGVDTHNQISINYSFSTHHRKWWRCVFIRMLEMNLVNSYIYYKTFIGGSELSHKEYRIIIIKYLLSFFNWKKSTVNTLIDTKDFFIIGKKLRCKLCYKNKIRKESYFQCKFCSKNICMECQINHTLNEHIG